MVVINRSMGKNPVDNKKGGRNPEYAAGSVRPDSVVILPAADYSLGIRRLVWLHAYFFA